MREEIYNHKKQVNIFEKENESLKIKLIQKDQAPDENIAIQS